MQSMFSLLKRRNDSLLTPEGQEAVQNVKAELVKLGDNPRANALIELIDLVSKSTLANLLRLFASDQMQKLSAVIDGGTGGCFIPVMDDTTNKIAEIVLKHATCFRIKNNEGCLRGIDNEILKSTKGLVKYDLNDFCISLLANYEAEKIIYEAGSTKTAAIDRMLRPLDLKRMQDPEAHASHFFQETKDLPCLSVTYQQGSIKPIKDRGKASVYAYAMESECQAIRKGLISPNDNFVLQTVEKLIDKKAIEKYDADTDSMIVKIASGMEGYLKVASSRENETLAREMLNEVRKIYTDKNDDAFTKLNKLESFLSDQFSKMKAGRCYNLVLDARAQCVVQMQKQEPGSDAWLAQRVADMREKYQKLAAPAPQCSSKFFKERPARKGQDNPAPSSENKLK